MTCLRKKWELGQLFKTSTPPSLSQSDLQHPMLTKRKYCSATLSHCSLRSQPPRAPYDASVFSDLDRHRGHNSQAPRGRRAQAWLQTTAGLCRKYDSGASCAGYARSRAHVNGTSAESELSLYATSTNDTSATRHRQHDARVAKAAD